MPFEQSFRRTGIRALPLIAGVLFTVVYLGAATWFVSYNPQSEDTNEKCSQLPPLAIDDDVVATGVVRDDGNKPVHAHVKITAYKAADQKLFERDLESDQCGNFVVRAQDIVVDLPAYLVQVRAETSFYLPGQSDHVITVRDDAAKSGVKVPKFDQPRIRIHSKSLNRWLTMLLFFPGIFGLLFSILHIAELCPGTPFSATYAFGTSYLWSLVCARMVYVFVLSGDSVIALFWPGLQVSSGVVVSSFLGTLTYAAFSVFSKPQDFHRHASIDARQKLLLTMGGRILVAPYLAIIALTVFGTTFPTLRTPPFELFLGFFTGLYITIVLKALNGIGKQLLSAEEQARVVAKGTALVEASKVTQDEAPQPSAALFDVVEQARKALLANHPTVIGVGAGTKQVDGVSAQAVTVYVLEKQELPESPVPEMIGGFPTTVQTPPPLQEGQSCHAAMLNISWEKVDQIARMRLGRTAASPGAIDVTRFPDDDPKFLILTCDPKEILTGSSQSGELFNIVDAFRNVAGQMTGTHQFIAFLLDSQSGMKDSRTNYYVPVFNEVQNIGFFQSGNPYDQRAVWGAHKGLRGCQVHTLDLKASPVLSHRVALHELGHAWSMYLRQVTGLTDSSGFHWSQFADNGFSPMDNDNAVFSKSGNSFVRRHVPDDQLLKFCPIDLYLMGLLPASKVEAISIFPADLNVPDDVPIDATPKQVTIDKITARYGARIPAASPDTNFEQAFVIVTASRGSGQDCARKLIEIDFLGKHEKAFADATDGKARLSTKLF